MATRQDLTFSGVTQRTPAIHPRIGAEKWHNPPKAG